MAPVFQGFYFSHIKKIKFLARVKERTAIQSVRLAVTAARDVDLLRGLVFNTKMV